MRRAAQTGLVLLAVVCSLVLSGTATVALAAAVHVPGWAQPAAVGVIEVVLATGTWMWVTDPELRKEAAAAVVLASGVSAFAGVHAYGAFGLIGPAASLVTTHLVARSWSRGAPAADETAQSARETPSASQTGHAPNQPLEPELREAEPGPAVAGPYTSDGELVSDLRAHATELGRMPGRDAVKARYGVGSSKADRLRDAAAKPDIRAVI